MKQSQSVAMQGRNTLRRWLVAAGLAFVALGTATAAQAQDHGRGPHGAHHHGPPPRHWEHRGPPGYWRHHRPPPGYYYGAPPVVIAPPPPVYYAPPPPMVYGAPGLNIIIPIR
ncbi:MAG TPA: hypothetical protein VN809_08620 [Telmatospirillum sp.]|nr:hypothetical protein [Telmatospirillum sp.]